MIGNFLKSLFRFIKGHPVHLNKDLDTLFNFPLVNMICFNMHGFKEMLNEVVETLMFFTFILQYQVVCAVILHQRHGNVVLSVEMLFDDELCQRLVYTLEFGVEGTIVELYLFDDRRAFNVVVVCRKF